jgi:hypothetical protein
MCNAKLIGLFLGIPLCVLELGGLPKMTLHSTNTIRLVGLSVLNGIL